jgi:hypothetical protein
VEPLAPARYHVRFTASAELRDKLERLQALMRSSVPDGDLAKIIDIAVSEKLLRVEARRFGRTKPNRSDRSRTDTSAAPRGRVHRNVTDSNGPATNVRASNVPASTDTPSSSRHIPAAVRRLVYARDGGRCAYRDRNGMRCARRHDLEFHHKHPFAHGGDHSPANLALMCRAHNALLAEQDYGADVMERFRSAASGAKAPVDAYGARIVVRPRRICSG